MSDVGKRVTYDGVTYECKEPRLGQGCADCAFGGNNALCASNGCDGGVYVALPKPQAEKPSCGACVYRNRTFGEDPCNQCVGDRAVPVGQFPKFKRGESLEAHSAVTQQLQAAANAELAKASQEMGLYDTDRPTGPAAAPQECRSPYCECEPGKCRGGRKDMRGTPVDARQEISQVVGAIRTHLPALVAPLIPSEPVVAHEAPKVSGVGSKPSNPKDLIGARKVPMSVVPAGVLMETGLALLEGAGKYGRHNYRAVGVRAGVYYDAAMGHMMDWWEGDDIDADSGLSHVVKAIASLVVLRDAMLQGKLTDDRPPRSKVYKRDFNDLAAAIIDRHADKNPKHYTISD